MAGEVVEAPARRHDVDEAEQRGAQLGVLGGEVHGAVVERAQRVAAGAGQGGVDGPAHLEDSVAHDPDPTRAGGTNRLFPIAGRCYGRPVTWLPIDADAANERDAVLGMHPEAYAAQRKWLDAAAAATDAELLEVCRARMGQELRCREELARHPPELLADLERWDRIDRFSERERAALEFVEQFLVEPSLVTRENVAALEAELGGPNAVVDFANAVSASEASMRLSTLLDLEPSTP
jgi:alkylhydroperoxidase family enzyme